MLDWSVATRHLPRPWPSLYQGWTLIAVGVASTFCRNRRVSYSVKEKRKMPLRPHRPEGTARTTVPCRMLFWGMIN